MERPHFARSPETLRLDILSQSADATSVYGVELFRATMVIAWAQPNTNISAGA